MVEVVFAVVLPAQPSGVGSGESSQVRSMTVALVLLVLGVAAAGGILGELLQLHGLLVPLLVLAGAVAGAVLWFLIKTHVAR